MAPHVLDWMLTTIHYFEYLYSCWSKTTPGMPNNWAVFWLHHCTTTSSLNSLHLGGFAQLYMCMVIIKQFCGCIYMNLTHSFPWISVWKYFVEILTFSLKLHLMFTIFLIFVVPSIMLYSSEISPTRCNNCVFILRNGFTLNVSGDNLTHHQEHICCIWPQVSRLT